MATFHAPAIALFARFRDNELNYLGCCTELLPPRALFVVTIKLKMGLSASSCPSCVERAFCGILSYRSLTPFTHAFRCASMCPFGNPPDRRAAMGGGVMLRQLALQLDILILYLDDKPDDGRPYLVAPYRSAWPWPSDSADSRAPAISAYSRTAHLSPARFKEAYQWSVKFFAA